MSPRLTAAALIALLVCMVPVQRDALGAGDTTDPEWAVEELDETLPLPLYRSSCVWSGSQFFVFSGRDDDGNSPVVVRFDPATGEATLTGALLPSGRIMSSAAYIDPYAYIFGGQDQTGILSDVVRYDTLTDEVATLDVTLPEERMGSSAVAVGDSILIFGGRNDTGHVDTVFRFTPSTGSMELAATLPVSGGGRVCVSDGGRILMFGGCGVNCALDGAWEFDPATMRTRTLNVSLPHGVYWTSGVWAGDCALIIGGNDYAVTLDEMYAYYPGGAARGSDTPAGTGEDDGAGDPGVEGGSGRSAEASGGDGRLVGIGALPKPLELSASFFDGNDVYVLGGSSGLEGSDAIYRIYRSDGAGAGDEGDEDGDGQIPFAGAAAFMTALVAATACLAGAGGRRR